MHLHFKNGKLDYCSFFDNNIIMTNFDLSIALPKIKDYLLTQEDIAVAYLFGSYATGKQRPDSDLDVGIVFSKRPNSYNRLFEIGNEIENLIKGPKVDVREFDLADSPVFLASSLKSARLICDNNPLERIKFEIGAMREYEDTKKLRQIQYYYMQQRIKEGKYAD